MNRRFRNVAIDRVADDAGDGNATSRINILNALRRAGATWTEAKSTLKAVTAKPSHIVPKGQLWLWHIGEGMFELAVEGQSQNDITENAIINDADDTVTLTRQEAHDCWEAVSEEIERMEDYNTSVEGPLKRHEKRQVARLKKLETRFKEMFR